MAFFQDDYFKRTPATLQQVRGGPPPTVPSNPTAVAASILERAKTGKIPTAQEVQVALRNLMATTPPGQKKSPEEASLINALMYDIPKYASKPQLYNNPADAFPPPAAPKPNNIGSALIQPFSKGMAGAATDAFNAIGNIASGLFGPKEESPEDMLRRLMGEAGSYQYNGPSAQQMAKQEFDPQFQILKDIANQTTSRYNTNKGDIANMYDKLVQRTIQGRGESQAAYDKAVTGSQGNYAAASQNLTDAATQNQTALAQEMARLGINEGTGDVIAGLQKNLQDNVGRLSAQGQGTQDLLKTLGANQYGYDTNAINLNKQQGIQTQQDFLADYMNSLAQNDQQRLALTGQQQQAANNYGLQIQKMLQEGNSSLQGNVLDMFSALQGANNNQAQRLAQQAQLDLDQSKFDFQKQQAAAQQGGQNSLNAYDALAQRAAQVYQGDPVKTRQAVDEILAAYQNNPNAKTVGDFLNGVDQDTLRSDPALTSLIYDFMTRVLQSQPR